MGYEQRTETNELTTMCRRPILSPEARGAPAGGTVLASPRGAEKQPLEPDSVRTDGGKLPHLFLLPIAPRAVRFQALNPDFTVDDQDSRGVNP